MQPGDRNAPSPASAASVLRLRGAAGVPSVVTGGWGCLEEIESGRLPHSRHLSLRYAPSREMPDYPRACSRCDVLTAEADFGADRSKKSGHKSHCRACERADYASRKDELHARRHAVREAEREARAEST